MKRYSQLAAEKKWWLGRNGLFEHGKAGGERKLAKIESHIGIYSNDMAEQLANEAAAFA